MLKMIGAAARACSGRPSRRSPRSSPSAASRSARSTTSTATAAVHPDAAVAGEDDTALLQLTSGSTAEPKAVRITHRNLHANIGAMAQAARLDADRDVMVSWLPLFHDMGMVGFLTVPMTLGLELVTRHPARLPGRPLLWAELISQVRRHRHGRTELRLRRARPPARPRTTASLDLSSLRFALNGAEPIDPVAVARVPRRRRAVRAAARGGALRVRDGGDRARGVVRAGGDGAGRRRDRRRRPGDPQARHARHRAASFPMLGPPLPGIEVRVVGDDGAVLGEREVGVLQLRGPSVTPGYLTVRRAGRHAGRRRLARHRRRGLPGRRRRSWSAAGART